MSARIGSGGTFGFHHPHRLLINKNNPFLPQDIRRGRKTVRLWPNFQAHVSKNDAWIDPAWLAWLDECEVRALDHFQRHVHQPSGHNQPKWVDAPTPPIQVDPAIIARYSNMHHPRYEKQKAYRLRNNSKGLCQKCTQPAEPNRNYCKRHLGKDIKRQLHERMAHLATLITRIVDLKLCPIRELAEMLETTHETARKWKKEHMQTLLARTDHEQETPQ